MLSLGENQPLEMYQRNAEQENLVICRSDTTSAYSTECCLFVRNTRIMAQYTIHCQFKTIVLFILCSQSGLDSSGSG
jgi:hypothetical protein